MKAQPAVYDRNREPMGGAPYKSAKEEGGALSSVSTLNQEKASMSCLQRDSIALKQITGLTIPYNRAACGFKVLVKS